MAREQLNYTATAWKDLEAGGTAITAARLNNIETGIADADAAVNAVNATVLTYLVASDGDTATTDINGAAITGPCFVHDLGTGDTYLDKGQEDQSRVQVGVSKAAFDALQESVSRLALIRASKATFGFSADLNDAGSLVLYRQDGTGLAFRFSLSEKTLAISNTDPAGGWTGPTVKFTQAS